MNTNTSTILTLNIDAAGPNGRLRPCSTDRDTSGYLNLLTLDRELITFYATCALKLNETMAFEIVARMLLITVSPNEMVHQNRAFSCMMTMYGYTHHRQTFYIISRIPGRHVEIRAR